MSVDAHTNFAYSTVLTAPIPASSGTALTVQSGNGALFPTPPFNATVWPTGVNALTTNAEIVRVTAIVSDVLTITRTQEGTSARSIVAGDQIAATISVKTLTDIETSYGALAGTNTWTAAQTVNAQLNTQTIVPSTTNTYVLGFSSAYWSQIYGTRHYFNSTAYIDGSSAGVLAVTGTLNANSTTQAAGDNTTSIATDAFVQRAVQLQNAYFNSITYN